MTVTELPAEPRRLRCALFVDFDNVYIGLQQLDQAAAERFARDPGHWLGELTTGADDDGAFTRRFLVRNCYLNPARFADYRPNFTRAGFQVVDCPSLTQQGKSSADINLVLDAVDALGATTHYDEFVILSADADFTPLIQRCRADDRRVTVVTGSQAASAYRAVADTVIDRDALLALVTETAALADDEPASPVIAPAPEPSGDAPPAAARRGKPAASVVPATPAAPATQRSPKAGRAVRRLVQTADRPVPLSSAAQAAQQADPDLPTSKWGGAGSFSRWLEQTLPGLRTTKDPSGSYVWDPERFDEADLPGATAPKDVNALQRRVVEVTDVPGLTQANYRILLARLADDLARHAFDATATPRRVYDACQKAGAKVGHATVRLVISGILETGLALANAKPAAEQLAAAWAENVVGRCRGARIALSRSDERAIRTWVGGGLEG